MKQRFHLQVIVCAGIAVASSTPCRAADLGSVDGVLAFVTEKVASYKDWSANFEQTIHMGSASIRQVGTMIMRPPLAMRMNTTMDIMGQSMTTLLVSGADGIAWTEVNAMGMKQIMKMDLKQMAGAAAQQMGMNGNPLEQLDPAGQVKLYKSMFDLELKEGGELEGQEMILLAGKIKSQAETANQNPQLQAIFAQADTIQMYIGKQDGFGHKVELYDAQKQPVMTHHFSNLKFNQAVSDETFQYTPPEGVAVMDLTALGAPAKKPEPAEPTVPQKGEGE